jgi:hypothetical protein
VVELAVGSPGGVLEQAVGSRGEPSPGGLVRAGACLVLAVGEEERRR